MRDQTTVWAPAAPAAATLPVRYGIGAAAMRENHVYSCRATGLDLSGFGTTFR